MNNKKKVIIAGSLAAFLAVGGTAAFFTSSDSIANIFNTGKGDTTVDPDKDAGVDVEEDFRVGDVTIDGTTYPGGTNPARPNGTEFDDNKGDNNRPGNEGYGEVTDDKKVINQVLPGEAFIKKMNIGSNVDYYQYLRAQIVITVDGDPLDKVDFSSAGVDKEGNPLASAADLLVQLNNTELTANWNKATVNFPEDEGGPTDYYFYKKTLAPGAVTPDLVQAVVLKPTAGNFWKGKKINVELHAEGIQATTDAWASWMTLVEPDLTEPTVPTP